MLQRIKKFNNIIKNTSVFPLNNNINNIDNKTVFIKFGAFSSHYAFFQQKNMKVLYLTRCELFTKKMCECV